MYFAQEWMDRKVKTVAGLMAESRKSDNRFRPLRDCAAGWTQSRQPARIAARASAALVPFGAGYGQRISFRARST
jgi:hypothetical protein